MRLPTSRRKKTMKLPDKRRKPSQHLIYTEDSKRRKQSDPERKSDKPARRTRDGFSIETKAPSKKVKTKIDPVTFRIDETPSSVDPSKYLNSADGKVNAFLITNYNREAWVEVWIRIIRSFKKPYFICVSDNYQQEHKFPNADMVLRLPPKTPASVGDVYLINAGMKTLTQREEIRYIIKTSADTWLFKESKLNELLAKLSESENEFLSSRWEHHSDIATDFFIVSKEYAKSLFVPERFKPTMALPEVCLGKILNRKKFYYWSERDPIHDKKAHKRKYIWGNLGLVSSHNLSENRRVVLEECPHLKPII